MSTVKMIKQGTPYGVPFFPGTVYGVPWLPPGFSPYRGKARLARKGTLYDVPF
ncbi:MAG: hypothetical protein QME28_07755 [Candidatus Saccharicenans sp.]|nr:hypothetical protein [Candidatus Saccharicenans sp.]